VSSKASPLSPKGSAGSSLLSHQRAPLGPALQDSAASAPYHTPLPLVEILLNSESMSGRSFQSHIINTLGIWSQAHLGSLVHSASPHRSACSVLSMLSALDCKSTVGHLLCSLSMLSALDCKSTVGHLLCSICPCFRHWTTSPLWVTCSILSVHAFGTGQQAHCGSLVLFCLFSSFVSALCFRRQSAHINECTKEIAPPI
jgi:hypothetical protein